MAKYVRTIKVPNLYSSKPVERVVPCTQAAPGARLVTSLILLMFALTSFGQVPNYKTVQEYVLPESGWRLEQIPKEFSFYSFQTEDTTDAHELLYYNVDSAKAILCYRTVYVRVLANSVEESYNEYTGITRLEFKTMGVNDCSSKPWIEKLSIYMRPSSNFFFIEYDSPCDGIIIRTGDPNLKKALNMKYQPPVTNKPKKSTKIIRSEKG